MANNSEETTDTKIRGIILQKYYEHRNDPSDEGWISLKASHFHDKISDREICRISKQLHQAGLIDYDDVSDTECVGKITDTGVDVVERKGINSPTPVIFETDVDKSVFQRTKVEGGDSYQAGRDIHVTKSEKTPKSEKKLIKIAAWLGIIVAITTIITFVFDLHEKIKVFTPESARFYGIVLDEAGKHVADADIVVQEKEGDEVRIGFDKTSPNGEFNFIVKAKPKATIWVTVTKDGIVGFQGYKNLLGNTTILFKRE